jgi:hypothetical protein
MMTWPLASTTHYYNSKSTRMSTYKYVFQMSVSIYRLGRGRHKNMNNYTYIYCVHHMNILIYYNLYACLFVILTV